MIKEADASSPPSHKSGISSDGRGELKPGVRALIEDRRWARWLESLRSIGTKEGYARDATKWATWLAGRGVELHAATEAELTSWVAGLDDRGLAASTINRKVAAVTSYYKWAAKNGLVTAALDVENRPKVHSDPVRRLGKPVDEVKAQIRAAEPGLERALITLLAHTGVRISEATGADVTDIRTIQGRRVLQVLGKGRKQRTPPLTDEAWPAIRDYIGDRKTGPLFVVPGRDEKGKERLSRLDRFAAGRIVARVGERCGLKMHPHLYRHSAAVLMARAGYTMKQIATFLGHADIGTTALYLEGLASLEDSPAYGLSRLLAEDEETP
jgi:integrase/recombinase XerD